MGRVKEWGMALAEARTQTLYEQGLPWPEAAERAQIEVFGPEPVYGPWPEGEDDPR